MIKTVVRFHHWLPFDVYRLFLDEDDHLGLVYWYNDVEDELWKSAGEEAQAKYLQGLTKEQNEAHDLKHNPKHNENTGEWFLK
jgi:hypothetical protein